MECIRRRCTNLSPERTINLFTCLNELGDNSLVEEAQRYLSSGRLSAENLSPAQYSALAFVLLMSDEELDVFDLKKFFRSDNEHWRLLTVVKTSKAALLNSCNLTETCCDTLALTLRSNSSPLREMDLSNNDLQDSGVKLLSAGLGDSHCKLEILRLNSCNLTQTCCDTLALTLRSNSSPLRELDLSNNDLQDSGVKLLSAGLGDSHCKLEILRSVQFDEQGGISPPVALCVSLVLMLLSVLLTCRLYMCLCLNIFSFSRLNSCNLTETCCDTLALTLRSNSSPLRELDLSNNDLQDSGVKLLSAGLGDSHCKLEILRLNSCNLTETCCDTLALTLRSNSSPLRELDLSDNDLQDSGVKLLSAGLGDSPCKLEILRSVQFDGTNTKLVL
uniref:NACHT, LRR and PYD domains-containing protein 3-like n=1 Tax=Paramormyrops kingsleyae TaxID=1676925 RepID=A0A3B3QPP4_9TELE